MEHSFLMSGNGGQGIVLATRLLGAAAAAEGMHCIHFGRYGSEIRGTECECTMIVSTEPIEAFPILTHVTGAVAMHPQYFEKVGASLNDGGLLIYNTSLSSAAPTTGSGTVWGIPATEIATEVGAPVAASLTALGAFAHVSGLIPVQALIDALPDLLPPYRHQLLDVNRKAIRAGEAFARTHGNAPALGAPEEVQA